MKRLTIYLYVLAIEWIKELWFDIISVNTKGKPKGKCRYCHKLTNERALMSPFEHRHNECLWEAESAGIRAVPEDMNNQFHAWMLATTRHYRQVHDQEYWGIKHADNTITWHEYPEFIDKMMLRFRPPVRLCCGQSHYGAQCPDGMVMCCLCFSRFNVADLNVSPDGVEDVCKSCALEGAERTASKSNGHSNKGNGV